MNNVLSAPAEILLGCCEQMPLRSFHAGELILKEGSKTNRLYVLRDGGVEVRKDGVLLKATAETGTIFGEISALLDIPHTATVTAKVPSRLYEVPDAAAFIRSEPRLGMTLAKIVAKRLAAMNAHFSGAKQILDRTLDHLSGRDATGGAENDSSAVVGTWQTLLASSASGPALDLRAENGELQKSLEQRTRDLKLQVIERMRAERNLQQQFVRINLLNQVTRATSERQEVNSILRAVLRQLESNMPIDFGAVLLMEPEHDCIRISATRLKPQLDGNLIFSEGDVLAASESGVLGCIQGRMIHSKNTAEASGKLFELLSASGLNCAVAVPLAVAEKPFGILVGARLKADTLTSGECEFLRMLSDHVAVAAHQARLYEQLQSAYDELTQTQQAVMQQERLRALGEMASGIAHDINNTLSPIVVYAELLLQGGSNLSETAQRQLNTIRTAGQDIAHFVARMRDFYRKREDTDEAWPLNCNEIVEQVIDLTRPRWRNIPMEKGIVIDLCPDLKTGLPQIKGSAAEIREALTNLVLNAVDAMPTGGNLTVRTSMEKPCATSAQPMVVIEVIDTGVGMNEETRKRCLEPFFSTKGQRGTGLGLAMVYGIIERHDGRIEIDSTPGIGTTVRLILPAWQTAEISLTKASPAERKQALRILYIDDEPLLRDLLKETLELEGHSVAIAEDGEAGIATFREAANAQQPFDVVITDLGMPHMDGRQVAETIKKDFPVMPVILLTGWGSMLKLEGDNSINVDAVISKPPDINELRQTLETFCRPDPIASDSENQILAHS